MAELVKMKALRSWRNDEFEGSVTAGQQFDATETRARDLELGQLAVRISSGRPKVEVQSSPPRPLEFGEGGSIAQPSSSRPVQVQQPKTSERSIGTTRRS